MARSAAVQTMPEGATARREDGRYDWEASDGGARIEQGTEPTLNGAKARIDTVHQANNRCPCCQEERDECSCEEDCPHCDCAPTHGGREARRKHAWSGWGPAQASPKRHRVAGWDWDNYQNGYVSQGSRRFACSCGQQHEAPSYGTCKCGKIWNILVIGTGGDRHEAAAEKFIAREVPVREGVIVANRQRESFTLMDGDFQERRGYDLSDEIEDTTPWPSDHHPKAGESTMRENPTDWHSRDNRGKWTSGGAPSPNQFKKS